MSSITLPPREVKLDIESVGNYILTAQFRGEEFCFQQFFGDLSTIGGRYNGARVTPVIHVDICDHRIELFEYREQYVVREFRPL